MTTFYKWLQRDSKPQPLSLQMNTEPFSQTGLNSQLPSTTFNYQYSQLPSTALLLTLRARTAF